jgi:hypothetical protein
VCLTAIVGDRSCERISQHHTVDTWNDDLGADDIFINLTGYRFGTLFDKAFRCA